MRNFKQFLGSLSTANYATTVYTRIPYYILLHVKHKLTSKARQRERERERDCNPRSLFHSPTVDRVLGHFPRFQQNLLDEIVLPHQTIQLLSDLVILRGHFKVEGGSKPPGCSTKKVSKSFNVGVTVTM